MSTRMRALLAAVTIVLAVFGITLAVDDTNQDGRPDQVTVKVNEAAGDGQPTTTITVPEPVVDRAEEKLHDHLGSPAVPGTTQQLMNNAEQAADQIKATKPPLPTAGASPGIPGCRTRFVRNQSSRNGVRPVQHWLHYTVSPNRPGLSDVNAIVALFDRASFQASSHFVIDREGNCAYIVPLEAKSWTQAAANPWAVSYEIINSGSEATFMDSAGYAKLRLVMHEVSRRTGIPMKRGAVSACRPTVFGIVQHADGGICAGGHHDIGPFSIAAVVRIVAGPVAKPISASAKHKCVELNTLRRKARRPRQALSPTERKRGAELKASLRRGGYRCTVGLPGKRGKITRR